ncbi:MAG TPA: hydroxymethylbilane synthase [Acidobacteriaceae bacterium]|nr:hydroxymethylbilane synthase [Terriglobia bacterium]HVC90156.1 hydroxymethylbilane synthase [Acidobacteriaceae bacterium]
MIRIGSRGSALARWQADHIAAELRHRGHEVEIEILVTTGDRVQHAPFMQVGAKGMFTKEIEEALIDDRIDLAVHSLKDLPTELSEHFVIAAIPPRADPRDAFVSVQYENFSALPQGAKVGTSSLRRQAQLRALGADLMVCELRGNVDTRLRKLQEGQYEAIVLAAAGLDRLGLTASVKQLFSSQQMCPAAGQGALAIECRTKDKVTRDIVAALDDAPTRFAVTAERTALATLGGGCHLPVGVYCTSVGQGWTITGVVARPDGAQVVRETMELHAERKGRISPEDAGRTLANRLLQRGAGKFLAALESAPPAGTLRE